MTEQEQKDFEHAINQLEVTITTLETQRMNLSYQLEKLKRIHEMFVRLLPPDKQAEKRLFPS